MGEPVQRIRMTPGGVDENDDPIESAQEAVSLIAIAVAPGSTAENAERGRAGESVEYTVYFPKGADVSDGDVLIVRGERFRVRVRSWISPYTGRGGLEVLASRKVG